MLSELPLGLGFVSSGPPPPTGGNAVFDPPPPPPSRVRAVLVR